MTVVDVHAHVLSPELVRGPGQEEAWRPSVAYDHGRQVVELRGQVVDSVVGELSRIDVVLDESRQMGVDHVLVSPWVAVLPDAVDPGLAGEVCSAQNESLARVVRSHPGQVSALGAVTLRDAQAAAGQLEHAMASGLAGVEVAPSVDGTFLGDDRFLPFFEAAEALGALVFVHPASHGLGMSVFGEHYLWNSVANPVETAAAAARLVVSGVLERHPGLRILLAHGGGVLPAVTGRLRRAHQVRPEARARLSAGPEESLGRFLHDTVTHDRRLLRLLVELAGADHVLLGSDRPFDMGTDCPVDEVRALGLAPEDEARVLGGNAAALLGLARDGGTGSSEAGLPAAEAPVAEAPAGGNP
ncbi:MAG: amidohydrolase family protein [Acidimicrobiales bacterium]